MDAGELDTSADDSAGSRLRSYVDAHWTRKQGGIRALAERMNTTAETVYQWFRDDREPSLAHLRAMAEAFGVTRSEIVAAMDGDSPALSLDEATLAMLDARYEARLREALDARLGPARPRAVGG